MLVVDAPQRVLPQFFHERSGIARCEHLERFLHNPTPVDVRPQLDGVLVELDLLGLNLMRWGSIWTCWVSIWTCRTLLRTCKALQKPTQKRRAK